MNDNAQKLLSRLDFNYEGVTSKGYPFPSFFPFFLLIFVIGTPGTTLTHLLLQTPEPLHEVTEFDAALQKRINNTHQILARVVETVEKERGNNERITALLKGMSDSLFSKFSTLFCIFISEI